VIAPRWALVVLVVLAACGGGDDDGGAGVVASATTSAARPPEASPTSPAPTTGGSSSSSSAPPSTSGTPGPSTDGAVSTSTAPEDTSPIVNGGPSAATSLNAASSCEGTPPAPVVRFRWQPSGAGEQRLDVTVLADGFETGDYETVARLAAGADGFDWGGAAGEAEHRWRVLTRSGDVWVASDTAVVAGPGCVGVDEP